MLRFDWEDRLPSGRLTRRQWLQLGALAGASALSPSAAFAREAAARRPAGFGRAKSVLLIYASGGQSQLDMWDPKPEAPAEVRGDFSAIGTSLPGVAFCEHMPRLARWADRLTLIRSMSHEDLDHGSATYLALTGRYHPQRSANPDPLPSDFPTYAAVLKRVRPHAGPLLWPAAHVNGPALVPTRPAPGQFGGLLGREYDPLVLGDVREGPPEIDALAPLPDLPVVRLSERLSLKDALAQAAGKWERQAQAQSMSLFQQKALEMLSSPRCRRAFDLEAEPESLRDRYGRHRAGQACLMARRLVEAGMPLVTVIWSHSNRGQDQDPADPELYGWDTHNDIFYALKEQLLPRFDATFATLLEDLDQRGLLDETLVICMGEFGRAPRVALERRFAGTSPGRKHWASVYSIVMAGAGVARGSVVGASDRLGAEPLSERYGPWDVAATIFSALGIDPAGEYYDQLDRPFPICVGRPIEAAYRG